MSRAKIREIDKLTKKGDIARAIECCQELLLSQPEDTNLHIRLGDLYLDRHLDIYQAKQYIDEAITEYQKAAEVLIDNGEVYYKIAIALYHKGDIDKAINYFNIAIEKSTNLAQCYYMIANCLKKKDRFGIEREYYRFGKLNYGEPFTDINCHNLGLDLCERCAGNISLEMYKIRMKMINRCQ